MHKNSSDISQNGRKIFGFSSNVGGSDVGGGGGQRLSTENPDGGGNSGGGDRLNVELIESDFWVELFVLMLDTSDGGVWVRFPSSDFGSEL